MVFAGNLHFTIQGRCFKFNRLLLGDTGNDHGVQDVTVDDVSMWIFDISGGTNVTVENSTVGPSVTCHRPSDGFPAAYNCQNTAADNEQFWYIAQRNGCNCYPAAFDEPKVHDNTPGCTVPNGTTPSTCPTSNVVINNNLIWRMSARNPAGQDPSLDYHNGCFFEGYSFGTGLTLSNNRFQDCMTYNILGDNPTSNWTITGNTFTAARDSLRDKNGDDAGFASVPTEPGFEIGGMKCANGYTGSNDTYTNNIVPAVSVPSWDWGEEGGCSGNMTITGLVDSGNTLAAGATIVPSQPFSGTYTGTYP